MLQPHGVGSELGFDVRVRLGVGHAAVVHFAGISVRHSVLEDVHVEGAFRQTVRAGPEALFHRLAELSGARTRQREASELCILLLQF